MKTMPFFLQVGLLMLLHMLLEINCKNLMNIMIFKWVVEIVYNWVDSSKDNIGLTNFKEKKNRNC